MKDKKW